MDEDEPVGIGGWLAFFVVSIGIFGPIGRLVGIYRNVYADPSIAAAYTGHNWLLLQAGEWTLCIASILGCWFLVWRLLYRRTWQTVLIVIAGLWTVGLGAVLLEVLMISLIASAPILALVRAVVGDVVQPIIIQGLWTAYFLRSRRVANTYPRQSGEDVVAVFS